MKNKIELDEFELDLPVQAQTEEMENHPETVEKIREKTREKTMEKIIFAIRENPTITASVLAESLSITVKGVEWQLKKFQDQGIIRRVGPDKGGHWEVIDDIFP